MRNAEETSAEQLSRTANSKPSRTSGFTGRFPTPGALPAEKTRIPRRGECSRTLDLFEEAVLVIHHHHSWKFRMRVNLLALTVGVPRGQSLPDAGISLKSLLVKIQKLYFAESWIVLAGPAALALPKSGELTTPMILVMFV